MKSSLLMSATMRQLLETIARRLNLGPGTWTLTVEFRNWIPCKSWLRRGPCGIDELEHAAQVVELDPEPA